ncbi:uncharacterized protein LOC8283336 [Ricinus communis]|uniref:Uncharacterized protein n=1 Tax=Ricinus communis TaxID=3988 RepID=B9SGX4_RICCO|nr:uncharacterized protein LOC8283336 [Ricinus communis]EEF37209.1 conserved hypothetical protein [Ricinus communis]|eukprot:XP_002525243.1 uncharacterized protein LOC8283336 [Ricinus communis]
MGCISSKLMPRSTSLKEELNQSMQRSASGSPALEESVPSQNINDQFLALVSSANTVARRLRSRSFSDKNTQSVIDHNTALTSNTRKQGGERARSRSWLSEIELPTPIPDTSNGTKEEESDHKGVGRARSFHTVEEYDAMIRQLSSSGALHTVSNGKHEGSRTKLQQSLLKEGMLEENSKIDATSELGSRELIANPNISPANKEVKVVEDSSQEGYILEKGLKRKSIAKRLHSLQIPHTIEFSAVASLREWLNSGGQVYSPAAYVTPKLGKCPLPNSRMPNECNEGDIFNPELVVAFEEPMLQLEAEAESILKHISENLEKECPMEKQPKDEISHARG